MKKSANARVRKTLNNQHSIHYVQAKKRSEPFVRLLRQVLRLALPLWKEGVGKEAGLPLQMWRHWLNRRVPGINAFGF